MRELDEALAKHLDHVVGKHLERLVAENLERLLPKYLSQLLEPRSRDTQEATPSAASSAASGACLDGNAACLGEVKDDDDDDVIIEWLDDEKEFLKSLDAAEGVQLELGEPPPAASGPEEVIDLSDSLPRDALEDEAAIPDSQELMRRPEMLANWYARWHMSKFSTKAPTYDVMLDAEVASSMSTEELYDEILDRLRNIPDQVWQKDGRRLNVLPEGETRSKQLILGWVTAQAFRNLPTISKETWCLSQLTKILLVYINRLAKENGWGKIHGSTLQLTKNLQTVEHQDQNNGGKSYGTTFGEHTGGGLWVEDANGEEQVAFPAHLKKEGSPEVLRGNRHQPRRALVQFDGNRIHCTCPFQGERYAVILFGLKPGAMEKTSELNQAFLSILGFNLGLGGPPPSHQHLELGRRAAFRQRVDYHPPRVPPMFTRGKKRKTA